MLDNPVVSAVAEAPTAAGNPKKQRSITSIDRAEERAKLRPAVIFAHNHPSGAAQPSQADERLTRDLQAALRLVDVKVLDHFIVAGEQLVSFSERGLL